MKRKITVSFLIMALVCCLIGGATFALFTDDATNENNTFAAGTLVISATDTAAEWTAGCSNMAPGDVKTATITVKNEGSLELRYDVDALLKGQLFTTQGSTPCAAATYTHNTATFTPGTDNNFVLAPGASDTIVVTVTLPTTAGNEYQGDAGTLKLTFNAEQTAYN